jgi:hypothetical protein
MSTVKGTDRRKPQIMRSSATSALFDPLFDRKIDVITEGIDAFVIKKLRNLSEKNVITITNFMLAITTETNPSNGYRQQLILRLCELSKFVNDKEFKRSRITIICILE